MLPHVCVIGLGKVSIGLRAESRSSAYYERAEWKVKSTKSFPTSEGEGKWTLDRCT